MGRLDACQKRFRSETPKDSGQAPILMTPPVSYVIRVGILFAIYFATAKLGLMIDAVGGFATLVWPPTGISLAALLLFGLRLWPGIALGAFLVNFLTGAPALTAGGMALGTTLEHTAWPRVLSLKKAERKTYVPSNQPKVLPVVGEKQCPNLPSAQRNKNIVQETRQLGSPGPVPLPNS